MSTNSSSDLPTISMEPKSHTFSCFYFTIIIIKTITIITLMLLSHAMGAGATDSDSGAGPQGPGIEAEFMRWVQYVGSRPHPTPGSTASFVTVDQKAPSRSYITVDGQPSAGHFTTIQAAIDSVPDNNVLRVKIVIAPGIYT